MDLQTSESIAMKHFRRVSSSSGTSRLMILSSPDFGSMAFLIFWSGLSAHRTRTGEHWLTARTAREERRVHAPDHAPIECSGAWKIRKVENAAQFVPDDQSETRIVGAPVRTARGRHGLR